MSAAIASTSTIRIRSQTKPIPAIIQPIPCMPIQSIIMINTVLVQNPLPPNNAATPSQKQRCTIGAGSHEVVPCMRRDPGQNLFPR